MKRKTAFNVRKAAQVAAYFAMANGGSINVLKLVKLIYLADRHSMSSFDLPILNDRFVSMDKGPVNSQTYDHLKSNTQKDKDWRTFLSERKNHEVSLAKPDLSLKDFDELSRADLTILGDIWKLYGHMDGITLANLTHEICPEWNDPSGSSSDIPYERIFHFLGRDNAKELAELVREQNAIDRAFAL